MIRRTFQLSPAPSAGRRGSVLIVVLVVCLGLVAMTLLFGHAMLMNYRGADNELAGRQAEQAIEGAARYAQSILLSGTAGQLIPATNYQGEAVPVGEAQFWFVGRPAGAVDDFRTSPVFELVDEASKLNLNHATAAMLEMLPGISPELAAAIVDWRDTDDEVSASGAESETYGLRSPGYPAKNAPFESEAEVALLNGADWTMLHGEDGNRNGVLDPNEDDGTESAPADDSDGTLDPGILEYVTVFSREPNTRSDGTPRYDVTSGVPDQVVTLMRETFGQARATQIRQNVLQSLSRTDIAPPTPETPPTLEILQAVYEAIEGTGSSDVTAIVRGRMVNNAVNLRVENSAFGDPAVGYLKRLRVDYTLDGRRHTASVFERETLQLPGLQIRSVIEFFIRSGMTEEEFSQIADAVTVSSEPFLIGRVNVNSASATVLACLPGFDTTGKAAEIVAARANREQPSQGLVWIAGVANDDAAVVRAGPYLTGNTYQVSADIAAVGRHGRGYRRTRFVIENLSGAPQIVYRRDLAPLGWALGRDVREKLLARETTSR